MSGRRRRQMRQLDVAEVARLISGDLDEMAVADMHTPLQDSNTAGRAGLRWQCERLLRGKVSREERVRASKILVALLPDSLDTIRGLVSLRESRDQHEVHFSLFCFLGDVRELHGSHLDRRLLDLLRDYLVTVRSEAALAAWKAGDTIASCWSAGDAVPALGIAAKDGRYVAGRLGALSGLEEILKSSSARSKREREIESVIRSICMRDRSSRVRNVASFALNSGR